MIIKAQKTEWMAELRSGTRKQVAGQFYKDGAYCCLGVLANVCGLSNEHIAPYKTLEGCGLPDLLDRIDALKLARMNDGLALDTIYTNATECEKVPPKSFAEIADWIEVNIKTEEDIDNAI